MVVPQTLRVLHVEDDSCDALLVSRELQRGGLSVFVERVDTEAAFTAALTERDWDLILADERLPGFSGLRALAIYRDLRLDLPFILISGAVSDQAAIDCMRAGAHDYILKDRMARLVPVVLRECNIHQERRRAEERYRLLVENCNDLIAEITVDGEVRYASPNHEAQLGLGPGRFVGTNLFDRVHEDDRAVVLALVTNHERHSVVYRFRGDDRAIHWLESSGRTFLSPGGEERIVVITRDISERMTAEATRRQLEAQLRQAQKLEAIGTLAGGIAHDFNNILMGVVGNVQLAQFDLGENNAALDRLDAALQACQRARDLVSQILTFSRQREQAPITTKIDGVVGEALRLLRASLPANIEFVVALDSPGPAITCDPTQIHQIVMNLGTNAAYAMRERGGQLRVRLEPVAFDPPLLEQHPQLRPGRGVSLTVADTGCGMDAATQQRLFEPFFTTKPTGEGTGLGLAVVHGIVKSHDAAITLESAPGRGTTFHIYFPAAAKSESTLEIKSDAIPPGGGERLLLIDDESSVTAIAQLMLERIGYEVAAFSDATAALAEFKVSPRGFDAVITNFAMPALSGLDIAREVLSARPDLPVIFVSGNMDANDLARARAAGVCAILQKPFSVQMLAQRLAEVVGAKAKSA